jgi:hypothetical protein
VILTPEMYWMGRDVQYAHELTNEIRDNAADWLGKANLLLAFAEADGVEPGIDQVTHTPIASGWRPLGVNSRTSNAATLSPHIKGNGGDLQDQLSRALAAWCLANGDALKQVGLWMERPQWTCGKNNDDPWVHWQRVPPRSGKRFFIPSTAPAGCAPMPGELEVA